jgi:hypothetical protein
MKSLFVYITLAVGLCIPVRDALASPDMTWDEWEGRWRGYLGSVGTSCRDQTLSNICGTVGGALSRYGGVAGQLFGLKLGGPVVGAAAGIALSRIGDAIQEWDGWVCYCMRLDWREDIYWVNADGDIIEVTTLNHSVPCCLKRTISTLGGRGEKCYDPAPTQKTCMIIDYSLSSEGTNDFWCPR